MTWLRLASHRHHRARRRCDDSRGDAADKELLQTCTSVRADDQEIGVRGHCTGAEAAQMAAAANVRRLVVIAATWGEGEPPGRGAAGYAARRRALEGA